jgi:hypothetical protein
VEIYEFAMDMLRDRRFLFDPANHGEAVKIVSEFTKIPPDKLDSWLFTRNDFYRDPDARPDLITLQANMNQLHKEGALKQALDVRKYSDLSYLEEAIKRMK